MPEPASPQYLIVARIMRPHGVRGDVRVQALTAFPDRLKHLAAAFLTADADDVSAYRPVSILRSRHDKADYWLMRFAGVEDRDAADRLRGQFVLVALADAVPLEPDEIYLFQVIGLEVRTLEGVILGKVVSLIETGANDVYVVHGGPLGEVLIPAIPDVVRRIDPDAGVMLVSPLPGLLPGS